MLLKLRATAEESELKVTKLICTQTPGKDFRGCHGQTKLPWNT